MNLSIIFNAIHKALSQTYKVADYEPSRNIVHFQFKLLLENSNICNY